MTSTSGRAVRMRGSHSRFALLLAALSLALLAAGGLAAPSFAATTGHISGTVTLDGGGDPQDVTARVLAYDSGLEDWETVDDIGLSGSGGYTFSVPAGSYRVCASGDGFEETCFGQTGNDAGTATAVAVASGQSVVADFAVKHEGTLAGQVLDTSGSAAAGEEVLFYDAGSAGDEYDYYDSVTTDDDGHYESALPQGTYKIGFGRFNPDETRPAQPEFYPNKHAFSLAGTLTVAPNTHQTALNAQLDTGASISGHVDGPTSADERGDLRVTAYAKVGGVWTARRDRGVSTSTGDYLLDGLPSGTYRVCVADIDLWHGSCEGGATVETADDIDLTAPEHASSQDLALVRKGTISGRVLGGGQPLEGLDVEAISTVPDSDGDFAKEAATTDATGHYTIALLPGKYVLHFVGNATWAPEYYNDRLYQESASPFTVADKSTATADDAVLVKGASISGKVTTLKPDTPGDIDVVVTNHGTGERFVEQTSSTGSYTIRGLPEGPYEVSFGRQDDSNARTFAPEYWNNVHEGLDASMNLVWVSQSEGRTGIDATLETGATITGKVVRADNTPVAGCPVHISAGDDYYSERVGTTKADGSFTVVGLGEGKQTMAVGRIAGTDPDCGLGVLYYDGDEVLALSKSPSGREARLGITTTLGSSTPAGTLVYSDSPVTETATTAPTITGTPNVRSLLTAHVGTWTPTPTSYGYVWMDNGVPIPGKEAPKFTPGDDLLGHKISVKITAHKSGATTGSVVTAETPGLGEASKTPVNTVKPTFTAPKVGATLTANPGTWVPSDGVYTYQWRNGNQVLGKGATFVVPSSMYHKTLTLGVRAYNDNPDEGVTTSKGVAVRAGTISFTTRPTISGTAKVGHTMKYVAARTTPSVTYRSYRWLRAGKPISGATGYSRKLTSSDRGHTISLKVTYRRTGYTTAYATTVSQRVG